MTSQHGEEAALDALVDDLLGTTPRPVDWARLPGHEAAGRWVVLDEWVRWLAGRYALEHREVPPCWFRHGPLVEELSALHTAHLAAYDRSGQAAAPADWHQTLAATRTRIRDWTARTGCRPSEHRDDSPQAWASHNPPRGYRADLKAHVEAFLDARAGVP